MAEEATLAVGDPVRWRPMWGFSPEHPYPVEVVRIEVAGKPVERVAWGTVQGWDAEVVVDLANGKWAYGDQLAPETKEGERA